jgi:hypothetical protein
MARVEEVIPVVFENNPRTFSDISFPAEIVLDESCPWFISAAQPIISHFDSPDCSGDLRLVSVAIILED